MAEVQLAASRRNLGTQSKLNQARKAGKIPGIYYIHGEEPIAIETDTLALRSLVFTAEAHIVSLKVDNDADRKCIMREVQFDPVTDRVIHFDLMGLRAGQKVRLEIPVVLEGAAIGVREGGIVQHTLHKLGVECLPADLPEHISIDISQLHIGDAVHIGDLKLETLSFLLGPEQTIVSIVHPKVVAEAAPTETTEAAAAEPEVIAKGKKEEGDEKEK